MKSLIKLLSATTTLSLATTGREGPHATPLFYALGRDPFHLIFLSDPLSRHMQEIECESRVSAAIYPEGKCISEIRGIQVWGIARILSDSARSAEIFFRKYPDARPFFHFRSSHRFVIIDIQKIRLIDNRLGFSVHREWDISGEEGKSEIG